MELQGILLLETADRLTRLRHEVADWAAHRRRLDPLRQFHTQLSSLEATLAGALSRLQVALSDAVDHAQDPYSICREFDRRINLLRRLWTWFAEKFDQRDRPGWGKALAAADEVCWAIHTEATRRARALGVIAAAVPAPLPFLDDVEAPEAVPRDEPPASLRPDSCDDLLSLLLARLPIPVVALSASVRWEPWSLVVLGHEVGHHLEHDLLDSCQLMMDVAGRVGAATRAAGMPDEDVARWQTWSHEVFADLVGLAAMGPGAVAAVLPYELGDAAYMTDRGRGGGRYPAPVVRLSMLTDLAHQLDLRLDDTTCAALAGMAGPSGPGWPDAPAIRRDLGVLPVVAATMLAPLDLLGTVPKLMGLDPADFADGGVVAQRAAVLRCSAGPVRETGPRVVRELVSATYAARSQLYAAPQVVSLPADDSTFASEDPGHNVSSQLAAVAFDAIISAREDGTRSAAQVSGSAVDSLAADLATALLVLP